MIAAVGMFDGVHSGHRYLIEQLKNNAEKYGLEPAVITFCNHPLSIINPPIAPLLITDTETKHSLLRKCGIDNIYVLPFDAGLRNLTARGFADTVLSRYNVKTVQLGFNNSFGSDRLKGTDAFNRELNPIGINVVDSLQYPDSTVSSSIIRNLIKNGDITAATALLGHPYTISGTVVKGRQIGRTIGFPTANLSVPDNILIPGRGVYAARVVAPAHLSGLPAMLNIGTAPTITHSDNAPVSIEAHIILPNDTPSTDNTNLDLYKRKLTLDIISRIRDEKHFDNIDALIKALEKDKATTLLLQ